MLNFCSLFTDGYCSRDHLSPDIYEESETDPGTEDISTRIFVALFDYDPLTMSPNPDAAEEELPFKEGQIIKVGSKNKANQRHDLVNWSSWIHSHRAVCRINAKTFYLEPCVFTYHWLESSTDGVKNEKVGKVFKSTYMTTSYTFFMAFRCLNYLGLGHQRCLGSALPTIWNHQL